MNIPIGSYPTNDPLPPPTPLPAMAGQRVFYSLTISDCEGIDRRRKASAHDTGSPAQPGMIFPALITVVNADGTVNLQVYPDGNHTHWATNVPKGSEQGEWRRA